MGLHTLWYIYIGPLGVFQAPGGGIPRHFVYQGGEMRELSIFVDESGADGLDSNYYLLTLVLHEQDRPIDNAVRPYERALSDKRLPE